MGINILQTSVDDFDPVQSQVHPTPATAAEFDTPSGPWGECRQTTKYCPETGAWDNYYDTANCVDEVGDKLVHS